MTTATNTITADQLAALRRFEKPAERSSDPTECHLVNQGLIAPLPTRFLRMGYPISNWMVTVKGRAVLVPTTVTATPATAPTIASKPPAAISAGEATCDPATQPTPSTAAAPGCMALVVYGTYKLPHRVWRTLEIRRFLSYCTKQAAGRTPVQDEHEDADVRQGVSYATAGF